MILEQISEILRQAIEKAYQLKVEPQVSYPETGRGDLSTNVAFQLAGQLKRPAPELAQELASKIVSAPIVSAEAVGGFINLKLSQSFWIEKYAEIGPDYGKSNLGQGQKIQVEFISANPTGPLTLANGRGGFSGDVIARVLKHCGYDVEREYYINDTGLQVTGLGRTLKGEEKVYTGDYTEDLKNQVDLTKPAEQVGEQAVKLMLESIKSATERMNIHYDRWFSEKSVVESGRVNQVLDILAKSGAVYESEGALWLATTKYGDDKDRVLRKSDGELTYLANDIAHYFETFVVEKFDKKINILGADHHGYVARMQAAVEILRETQKFTGKSDIIIMQLVRLTKGGQEVRMSKRAGTYVAMDDLLEEIPVDVARFFFLMRSADSHMDFDLDLAKDQSQKNPLHYIMYAYVRANSILTQAAERKLVPISTVEELDDLEIALIRQISRWPELVQEIATDYSVHKLAFFGLELAKLFHDLYESERIIDLDKSVACRKLFLISQFVVFMRVYFDALGITPVERMDREPAPA